MSDLSPSKPSLVGIFVGGRSSRMGSPKGLLKAPDSELTLVERLVEQAQLALPQARCVLVGQNAAYSGLGLALVPDPIAGQGPLGGIVGLLLEAEASGAERVLVVGCDFPFVSAALLGRLAEEQPGAKILCPHLDERYQPLVARYDVSLRPEFESSLQSGELRLQRILAKHQANVLSLSEAEFGLLVDWDRPEDVTASDKTKS